MVAISCVLFILQGLSIYGTFIHDRNNNQPIGTEILYLFRKPPSAIDFVGQVGEILGSFLPTIIGIILLFIAHKRKMKQNGLYKEPRKRSLFGIIVCVYALFCTLLSWTAVEQLEQSSEYWVVYVIGSYQQLRVFVTISTLFCLYAFFARRKWCYLLSAAVLIIGLFLFARDISIPEIYVVLVALTVIVYFIDRFKQNKQEREFYESMHNS